MFTRFMCLADREAENLLTEIMNQLWFTIYILVECQNTQNVAYPFVIANFSSSLGEYQVYLWEKFLFFNIKTSRFKLGFNGNQKIILYHGQWFNVIYSVYKINI